MPQKSYGLSLIASGIGLQLVGLCLGPIVGNWPYPRLALTAHVQAMAEGAMILGAGLVVKQTDILTLSPLQCKIISYGLNTAWIAIATEIANGYWGANQVFPIAASLANSKGGLEWQEWTVYLTHVAVVGMIPAFGVLTYELLFGEKGLDLSEKKENPKK